MSYLKIISKLLSVRKLKAFRRKDFTINNFAVPRLTQGFSITMVTYMKAELF